MAKVLVIEDEASIRETIVDTLEFAEYEVQSARNGKEGIQLSHTFEPDLILCDVMMPELNGYDVLLELNKKPSTAETPFIFLTAKVAKDDMRKGMVMGADDYLTKPFTSQELLSAVKTRLDRHKQIKKYNTQQMQVLREYINMTLPHELRTPLTGIMGYLYLFEEGIEDMDAETIRSMVSSMKNSAERLGRLIENFIAYSQLQIMRSNSELKNRLQNTSKLQNFETLVYEVTEKEAHRFGRLDDVQISIESATIGMFHNHASKLISVIVNNAFKFSKKGTPIEVVGKINEDNYILTVSNQGRGITEEQIPNVNANVQFEREKYEQQGAGMGLAIAQLTLHIYDGEMFIESEPEKTTSITMRFPLIHDSAL